MAQMFIGLPITADEFTEPTTGTSTASTTDVEIRVSATAQLAGITREQLSRYLSVLDRFQLKGGLNSAGANVPKL